MLLENDNSIFEVRLDSDGAIALEAVNRMARILLAFCFVLTLLVLASSFLRYLYYRRFDTAGDIFLFIELRIFPLLSILIMCLNYYQWTLYVKFTRQCSQSIRDRDQHSFNQSFRTMRKSMTMLIWVVCIDVLSGGYNLYASIRDYLHQN